MVALMPSGLSGLSGFSRPSGLAFATHLLGTHLAGAATTTTTSSRHVRFSGAFGCSVREHLYNIPKDKIILNDQIMTILVHPISVLLSLRLPLAYIVTRSWKFGQWIQENASSSRNSRIY